MKRILFFLCLLGVIVLIVGCGDDEKKATDETSNDVIDLAGPKAKSRTPVSEYVPEGGRKRFEGMGLNEQQIDDLMEIEAGMTEALIRWSYRDKAALYENEFECIRAKYSLEEYLNHFKVKAANGADTVVGYYVTGATFYDRDSVIVDDVVIFNGATGTRHDFINKDKLFYRQGRWIRPTLSTMKDQLDYENLIRQADSAAAAEEEEGF